MDQKELLGQSEISLWLDTYDDIFSDFDPRPYSERALSVDFLDEAKRASRDKNGGSIEMEFLVKHRNRSTEAVIKKRLREHFRKHHASLHRDVRGIIRRGAVFVAIGVLVMFFASLILFKNFGSLLASFLVILLEPAGWFFFWEGLGQIVFESKTKKSELDFYDKMTRCDIKFVSY